MVPLRSKFGMVNVGKKRSTDRMAVATGTIFVGPEAYCKVIENAIPKGDVLALAEIAGIQGAKKTSDLIPLCHPLPLDHVRLVITPQAEKHAFTVYCMVQAHAKTGVEMEALTGVQSALLTLHDLLKGIDPNLVMQDIRLLAKVGGKSGVWTCGEDLPEWLKSELPTPIDFEGMRCAVVVMSDRASQGIYEDHSGKLLKERLEDLNAKVIALEIIPDDLEKIQGVIQRICKEEKPDLLFTSGGLGLAPQDKTPEALTALYQREIPGFGELLRQDGSHFTPYSWISRSTAGIINQTLVIPFPGSPKAVAQGLEVIAPLLRHALEILKEDKDTPLHSQVHKCEKEASNG